MSMLDGVVRGLRRLSGNADWSDRAVERPSARHRCEVGCCPSHPVTTLAEGGIGVISCLTDPEHPGTGRLASMGLLPGVPVRLVQRYPAFVLRIGYAEIALDTELAGLVRVITGAK